MTSNPHKKVAKRYSLSQWFLGIIGSISYLIFSVPIVVLILQGINSGGWRNLPNADIIIDAIWLSLRTTSISLIIILVLGLPLAYIFARWQFTGKKVLQVFIELPIVMPPAVAGLALLLTFGRRGVVGGFLADIGINIAFTSWAVVIAQVFVAAPFFIRATQIGFESIPDELEDAARVDGASDLTVFSLITLPLSLRAISAGLVLSWARAMGEFGATILFAGSLQGRTQTMPLLVYAVFERDIDAAVWTGILLIIIAFIALFLSNLLTSVDEKAS
ncbi:MAG: ABC transporter permease [Phototrophicaceae bacterium]